MKVDLKFSLTIVIIAMLLLSMMPVISNASSVSESEIIGKRVAQINEDTYATLYEAVVAANASDTEGIVIELLGDSTEDQVITITRGLTINGNDFTVTSTAAKAFSIQTEEEVSIEALKLDADKIGIEINSTTHNVSLTNSTLTVGTRGIDVTPETSTNSSVLVDNCVIQKDGITDYDTEYFNNPDFRGIALKTYTNSTVDVKNTTVQGFAYAINRSMENGVNTGATFVVDNCTLKGRAGLNIWGEAGTIDIKNSTILGINNESGPTEGFGGIVLNSSNNTINVINTEVTNYQNTTGLENQNAKQFMILIQKDVDSTINISGTSSFVDTTNKISTPVCDTYSIEGGELVSYGTVKIISGTYNVPISEKYLPEGYVAVEEDGVYTVGNKATAISVSNSLDMTIGDESSLGVVITPSNTVEKVIYSIDNEEVATVNSVGMVTAKAEGTATITIKAGDITETAEVNVTVKEFEFIVPEGDVSGDEDVNVGVSQDYEAVAGVLEESLSETLKGDEKLAKDVEDSLKAGAIVVAEIAIESLDEAAVAEADKDKILAVVSEDGTIHQYLDISVLVKADGQKLGNITELTEPIKLSIEIPEDLIKENRTFFIVSLHEGETTKISGELEGTKLIFEVNEFSTYALAYEDSTMTNVPSDDENQGTTTNPDDTQNPSDTQNPGSTNGSGDSEAGKEEDNNKEESKDEGKEESKQEVKPDNNKPETGDNMIIAFVVLLVGAGVALVAVNKNQRQKEEK